jgi:hypothetical protein
VSDADCNFLELFSNKFASSCITTTWNIGRTDRTFASNPRDFARHSGVTLGSFDKISNASCNSWVFLTLSRPPPFASYYDTIFSNKISRRVFTPLLNKSHHCNPHKITFQTGGQVPSEHYTNRNNHIFTHRLAKDSKFHIHKVLNISWTFSSFAERLYV